MKRIALLTAVLTTLSIFPATLASAQPQDSLPESGIIPGKYIVVLKPGVDHMAVAARHAVLPEHVYVHALNGFAGAVPPGRLNRLLADPDVAWIEPDQVATIVGKPSSPKPPPPQATPTGIARIGVPDILNENYSSVGIAIIDTGIDLDHPELNVVGNISFVSGIATGEDDNGHGSHCAGIAAARNNDIGVRGVAPNASLYAVKVLNRRGSGTYSAIIAGVNWVAANAAYIKVANMSLGGGYSTALNTAVANAVGGGVVFCVAAGNSAIDASSTSPASCLDALTVSAISDSDGACGNDTFAYFSNFGSFIDIAAPGVNIYSTYKGGGYTTMSGTSMASPHVAGAAARYIGMFNTDASGTCAGLLLEASPQNGPCGFSGDPDDYPEPVLNVLGW